MAKGEYTDQHITPQAYLNRFAWKGDKEYVIGVWQKGKKGVEPKLYENAVKNVGYIKNFYDVGSRKDKKYWEKYYGRVFDPLYGKPLGNLIAKITLSRKESFYLIESEKRLLARINALKQAPTLKDIIVQPHYRFHKLLNKGRKNLEGYFAIDIKSHANPWRLILRPLDKDNEPFVPCNIDEIAEIVECVGIKEVSRHYE